ncbi:diguanylate cyclase domain-containing protein [Massilia consociata]|uniref:Diguanylate cyclase domain-containing protein n=1 Tax=Massilia consociata TaxID=760117 RepID=A0ABV6FEA7_9BURK
MHISQYQAGGAGQNDHASALPELPELRQLQARLAAGAGLALRLGAATGLALCERIGELLHETTRFDHSFVGVRAAGLPQVCGYRSRARVPFAPERLADVAGLLLEGLRPGTIATHAVAGTRFVAVALSADGAGVLGALCFTLADGAAVDAAALVQLAELGALRLAGTHIGHAGPRGADEAARNSAATNELGLLRTLVDNMPDHIYAKDRNGRFIFGNRAAAVGILGRDDVPALIGKSDLDFFPLACGQRFFTDEQAIIRTGQPIIDQVEENVTRDGPLRYFSTTKFPFHDEHGEVAGIVGISRDITARVGADEVARIRDRAVESSQDGILITCAADQDFPVIYTNPAFEGLTGFAAAEAKRCSIERFLCGRVDDGADAQRTQAGQSAGAGEAGERLGRGALIARHGQQRVLRLARKDGSQFWCEVRLATICAPDGSASHHVFTFVDVTAAHQAEEELIHLAGFDALTGLPNRRTLMERLGREVRAGAAGKAGLAVAFIDLDGLKRLNDEHGHEAGDLLLRTVAERISRCIRQTDMIARLGGDEFVLVSLHGSGAGCDPRGVMEFLRKVRDGIAQPLAVAGMTVVPTCSIGISVFGRHGHDAETLLRRADAAMYAAKRSGPGRIVFADDV